MRLWGRVSCLFRFSQVLPEEARSKEQLLKTPLNTQIASIY